MSAPTQREESISFLDAALGPVVIVGRPHSGSRMLAQFCLDHGVFLGADLTDGFLDSMSWYQRFVVPLMLSRYFPDWIDNDPGGSGLTEFSLERLQDTWPRYWDEAHHQLAAWGWKFCETLFVMPVIKRLFPSARFLHIIRDVRDVCLCDNGFFQLTGRIADPPGWEPAIVEGKLPSYFEFCCAITFGRKNVTQWNGIPIRDRLAVRINRFLIQAQSWLTCVSRARAYGRLLGDDYCEVRYEDFCLRPEIEGAKVLKFIGLPLPEDVRGLANRIHANRVQKWRHARLSLQEQRDFANAAKLADSLLQELGYSFENGFTPVSI
jgi:hypothetical protein